MCLSWIGEIFDPPSKEVHVGYKVFRKIDGEYHNMYFESIFELGKTYHDQAEGEITIIGTKKYPVGFHIYNNKADAFSWYEFYCRSEKSIKVVEVEYTDVVAIGDHVVARTMKLIKEI